MTGSTLHQRFGSLRSALLAVLLALPLASRPAIAAGQDVLDDVFYQIMPIAWRDSNGDPQRFGDFGGLTASLGYLDSLGVTALWMNPPFVSPAYHGYQHGAGDSLNPRFGTREEFRSFLIAAHARGIRVFVDFVAYGIAHRTPWFKSAYANPASPYDSWLAFNNAANTQYLGSVFQTWNADTVGFIHWDLRNSAPRQLVIDWAQLWLDPNRDGDFSDGVDGYRLDHVWETYPNGPQGWGYHIDTFWAPWRDSLRAVNPNVFVFAEQADWGSHGDELFVGMDGAFTKPFEFAARNALASGSASDLYAQMAATVSAHASANPAGDFLGTIGDHDVDRLASAIGTSFEKGKAAAAVLIGQPFPPVIYYGDEIGMRGVKASGWLGDAVDIPFREPFKWLAQAGPPMSNYFVLNADAYNNRTSQNNDGRSVQEQSGVASSLLETYRNLISLRLGHAALRRGAYHPVPASSGAVWAFVRHEATEQVLVAINVGGAATSPTLNLGAFGLPEGPTTPEDLMTGQMLPAITDANRSSYPLSLGAYGFRFLRVRVSPPAAPVTQVSGQQLPARYDVSRRVALQNMPTSMGDNVAELDAMFVRRTTQDSLYVGLTGNLPSDGVAGLVLLLDTVAGGQLTLDLSNTSPPPYGPSDLTGLRLDDGFAADHLFFVNDAGGTFYVDQFQLLTGGGTSKTYRGQNTEGNGLGLLIGGVNPNGIQVGYDGGNTVGVTASSAAGASTATTGIELCLPFANLGLSPGSTATIRLAAFLVFFDGFLGNQWLPGLGGGGNLGYAPDMRTVGGDQFVTYALTTAVSGPPRPAWTLSLASANPFRNAVQFNLSLPSSARARLTVFDSSGRRVRGLIDEELPAGTRSVRWDGLSDRGNRVGSGLYFVRLEGPGVTRAVRVARVE